MIVDERELEQKIIEHDMMLKDHAKKLEEAEARHNTVMQNITALYELISKMDKLLVRMDVMLSLLAKVVWGGVGIVAVFFLNELLKLIGG